MTERRELRKEGWVSCKRGCHIQPECDRVGQGMFGVCLHSVVCTYLIVGVGSVWHKYRACQMELVRDIHPMGKSPGWPGCGCLLCNDQTPLQHILLLPRARKVHFKVQGQLSAQERICLKEGTTV